MMGVSSGPHRKLLRKPKDELRSFFKIKDLGPIKFMLGWEVTRDRDARKITISQKGYAEKALEHFGMSECRACVTPMEPNSRLSSDNSPQTEAEKDSMRLIPYGTLVGVLLYLVTCTRPDLAFAVGMLGRYTKNPGMQHWEAAKRVLKYLKGTASYGITYGGRQATTELTCFTDSDWGGCADTAKSTSGYLVTMAGGALSWASRRQKHVATSSFAAEYYSASEGAGEVFWIRQLLQEVSLPPTTPTKAYIDNQTALMHLTSDMTTHKSKTIRIRYHVVREYIKDGELIFSFVPTNRQMADVLTKPVGGPTLRRCVEAMGLGEEGAPSAL